MVLSGGRVKSQYHIFVLPLFLLGWLQGGEHLAFDNEPTMADLHLSLLDKFGVQVDELGGSSAPLPI